MRVLACSARVLRCVARRRAQHMRLACRARARAEYARARRRAENLRAHSVPRALPSALACLALCAARAR
eukprot:8653034-Alexandrium_andersonii.AAC.1